MSEVLASFLRNESAIKKYLSRFFSRRQDIEDAAQDAFLRAFVTEARCEVRSPKRLLFRAAKHVALNELEKRANRKNDDIEDLEDSPVFQDKHQVSAEDAFDSKQKLLAFSKAVASLPPNCKKVFLLRKFEGLTTKEIAIRLKISVSGVEKHIAVGIVKCSQHLRDIGYEPGEYGHHPAALGGKSKITQREKEPQ